MTDDPVEQALAELHDLVRCRCHPAYTGRGLHDPDCECDSAEAVKIVTDRIEAQAAEIERLEAKLENVLGGAETVLEAWDHHMRDVVVPASLHDAIEEMRADAEEAKGGKDD